MDCGYQNRMNSGTSLRVLAAIACVICLVLVSGCEQFGQQSEQSKPTPTPAPTTGFVAGKALLSDAKEHGHAGVLVYLAGTSYSAHTDADGQYKISGVPAGEYTILAEKPGYQTVTIDKVQVIPETHTADHPFEARTAMLEKTGNGLANAAQAKTKQLGSILGSATTGTGTDENIRVKIEGTDLVTVTNEDGIFRFLNVEPGSYTLRYTKNGFHPGNRDVTVADNTESTVTDVVLEPEETQPGDMTAPPAPAMPPPLVRAQTEGDRTIQGIVELLDAQGKPSYDYGNVIVAIDNSDYAVNPDAQGRFVFNNLSSGIYRVLASLNNQEPQNQIADLTTQKTAQLTFRFGGAAAADQTSTAPATVTGHVVLPGENNQPLPDASGVSIGLAGTQATAISGQDGLFRLEKLEAGQYSLIAAKDGYEAFKSDTFELVGGQSLDLGEIVLEPKRDYPRVVSTNPADGTGNITVGTELIVQVKFSKKMDPASVKSAVQVQPQSLVTTFIGKGAHPLADDDNLVLYFNGLDERSPIKFGTTYQIMIAKTAADTSGLGMKDSYTFSFRTGSPGVVRTYPPNGDPQAFVNAPFVPIEVHFNTKLRPESLRETNFRVRPTGGEVVRVEHSIDPRTGWTTVYLQVPVQQDTAYTVTVERGVRAFNNQPLGNTPYTFRFHTQKMKELKSIPSVSF